MQIRGWRPHHRASKLLYSFLILREQRLDHHTVKNKGNTRARHHTSHLQQIGRVPKCRVRPDPMRAPIRGAGAWEEGGSRSTCCAQQAAGAAEGFVDAAAWSGEALRMATRYDRVPANWQGRATTRPGASSGTCGEGSLCRRRRTGRAAVVGREEGECVCVCVRVAESVQVHLVNHGTSGQALTVEKSYEMADDEEDLSRLQNEMSAFTHTCSTFEPAHTHTQREMFGLQ